MDIYLIPVLHGYKLCCPVLVAANVDTKLKKFMLDNPSMLMLWEALTLRIRCHFIIWAIEQKNCPRDAAQVLLQGQRLRDSISHPSPITVRNCHDELFNDLLAFVVSKDLKWRAEDVHSGLPTTLLKCTVV